MNHRILTPAAALTVGALALGVVAAAPANAEIVLGRGIGGVEINMDFAQVKQVRGAPVKHSRNAKEATWRYPGLKIRFDYDSKPPMIVREISTRSRKQRTSSGVGVGSSLAKVKSSVPKVKCSRHAGRDACDLYSDTRGDRRRIGYTSFELKDGTVSRVRVWIVKRG